MRAEILGQTFEMDFLYYFQTANFSHNGLATVRAKFPNLGHLETRCVSHRRDKRTAMMKHCAVTGE